jgi:hypothetical protein
VGLFLWVCLWFFFVQFFFLFFFFNKTLYYLSKKKMLVKFSNKSPNAHDILKVI